MTHLSPENAVTVTIIAQGDNENSPAEAVHHGLEYARKAGFIEVWSDPVAPAPENAEALELADQIEQSTGLIRMVPGEGTVQLGIRKTALVIAALRSGIRAQCVLDRRADEILNAELRGSTAEFLGWLTGLVPPSEKDSIPTEMRPAFDRMVSRLTDAARRYAQRAPHSSTIEACAKIAADAAALKRDDETRSSGACALAAQQSALTASRIETAIRALSSSSPGCKS